MYPAFYFDASPSWGSLGIAPFVGGMTYGIPLAIPLRSRYSSIAPFSLKSLTEITLLQLFKNSANICWDDRM